MPTMLTIDQNVGMVAPNEILARSDSEAQAIIFAQEQIGPVLVGSLLGNDLPMGTEVYTALPSELPATDQHFRHAVFEATGTKLLPGE